MAFPCQHRSVGPDLERPARILVVEDDVQLAGSLVRRLSRDGYDVELATDGVDAARRALAPQADFALVLLDLMIPRMHGLDLLKKLGATGILTIVVTARVDLADRLSSFELGAIDYVPKPFFLDEISARIRARLGRAGPPASARRVVRWLDVAIDLDAHTVVRGDTPVVLTRYEHALLAYLVARPGRAVSRARIAQDALPGLDVPGERTIDTHVVRLRRKLGGAGAAIVTVWGVGYRFDPAVAEKSAAR